MKLRLALLGALVPFALACGSEPTTPTIAPVVAPFEMALGARSMVPSGSTSPARLAWPITVLLNVKDNAGAGGVVEVARSVAKDRAGAVVAEATSTVASRIPAGGETHLQLELSADAGAPLPDRIDVSTRVRDAQGEVQVLERAIVLPR